MKNKFSKILGLCLTFLAMAHLAHAAGSFDGTSSPVVRGSNLTASGWGADYNDGSSQTVYMYVDGNYVGNATTGGNRPDVQQYNIDLGNQGLPMFSYQDITYCGWNFSYNTASLGAGHHKMEAVIDRHEYDPEYGDSYWQENIGNKIFEVTVPLPVVQSVSGTNCDFGGTTTLTGRATDPQGNLGWIYFWVSGPTLPGWNYVGRAAVSGSDATASINWKPTMPGGYAVHVEAHNVWDQNGTVGGDNWAGFTVSHPNLPPTGPTTINPINDINFGHVGDTIINIPQRVTWVDNYPDQGYYDYQDGEVSLWNGSSWQSLGNFSSYKATSAGVYMVEGGAIVDVLANPAASFSSITCSGTNNYAFGTSFQVYLNNPRNLNSVTYPNWTDAGGQDDISSPWTPGYYDSANDRWVVTVSGYRTRPTYHLEAGWYTIHVYCKNLDGNDQFLGAIHVYLNTTTPTKPSATISSTASTAFVGSPVTLTANFYPGNANDPITGYSIDSPLGTAVSGQIKVNNTSTYTFTPSSAGATTFTAWAITGYYFWISNGSNTTTTVTAIAAPSFTSLTMSPAANTTVVIAGTRALTATINNPSSATLTFSWQTSGDSGATWYTAGTTSGTTTSTYNLSTYKTVQVRCAVSPYSYSGGTAGGAVYSSVVNHSVKSDVTYLTDLPAQRDVFAGDPVSFTVGLDAPIYYTYQWYKEGVPVGTNSANYTITAADAADNGKHIQCIATYNIGSGPKPVPSNILQLIVRSPTIPEFGTQPQDVYIDRGSMPAVFSVTVSNTTTNTYDWKESRDGGATWTPIGSLANTSNYQGWDTTTLSILNPVPNNSRVMHGFKYKCTATNVVGPNDSNSATLTITTEKIGPIAPGWVIALSGVLLAVLGSRFLPVRLKQK